MNIQNTKSQKGFTIVELLIVIVVIGILAAISIVAYNGVTKKANATAAKGNASSVQKVAEAHNADETKNTYPADAAAVQSYSGITRVPSGVTVQPGDPTTGNGKNTIGYVAKGTSPNFTGGCVAYYDFEAGDIRYLGVGNGTVNSGATTCS